MPARTRLRPSRSVSPEALSSAQGLGPPQSMRNSLSRPCSEPRPCAPRHAKSSTTRYRANIISIQTQTAGRRPQKLLESTSTSYGLYARRRQQQERRPGLRKEIRHGSAWSAYFGRIGRRRGRAVEDKPAPSRRSKLALERHRASAGPGQTVWFVGDAGDRHGMCASAMPAVRRSCGRLPDEPEDAFGDWPPAAVADSSASHYEACR